MPLQRERFLTPEDLRHGERIAIYGAGGKGRTALARILATVPVRFEFFIDSFSAGEVDERPVLQLDDAAARLDRQTHVIVASQFWQEIVDQLEARGIRHYSIYDPNLDLLASQQQLFACIVRGVAALEKFGAVYERPGDLPEGARLLVLHESAAYTPLNLPGTCWEGRLEPGDPALPQRYAALPNHDILALIPASIHHHAFFQRMLTALPGGTDVLLHSRHPRKALAYVAEDCGTVFIPVPKCASTSLMRRIKEVSRDSGRDTGVNRGIVHGFSSPHDDYQYIDLDAFPFSRYFTFSFVRDPVQRLRSLYWNRNKEGPWLHSHIKGGVDPSIEEFAEFVIACPDGLADVHFESQHRLLTDSHGRLVADFVGSIENFHADWERLTQAHPVLGRVAHLNRSMRRAAMPEITQELRERLEARYALDYRLLPPLAGKATP